MFAENPVAFHISINVSDIDQSVAFFTKVFGTEPAKHHSDYAKFELHNPPITFSLGPISPDEHGVLNHVGFKLNSAEELVALQRRLEMAGLKSQREESVECCYSKQDKFWLHDPDGTLWEMYILEGDIDHRGAGQSEESVMVSAESKLDGATNQSIHCSLPLQTTTTSQESWSHRLGNPLTIPDEYQSDSLDEINLQGSFNGADTENDIPNFLTAVSDRLKPGGRVTIHCLTSDRHVAQIPTLPGPASVVKSVPCLDGLMDSLESAGFELVRLLKYGSNACFTAGDAEFRETMLEAFQPNDSGQESVIVVYAGPSAEMRLDDGTVLRRGRRAELPQETVNKLKSSPLSESITVINQATSAVSCTTS